MNAIVVTSKDIELHPEIQRLREIVIDAENSILGRLASVVVKLVKLGYTVYVINVEKAVVSGSKKMVVDSYKLLLNVRTHKNPYRHTMKRPRNPINIFKRAVKNMLPKRNWLGVQLLKKVKAYIGVPTELQSKKIVKVIDCDAKYLGRKKVVPVAVIAKELGWKTGDRV